jgi:uncharacterized protein YbaP (TraB family)
MKIAHWFLLIALTAISSCSSQPKPEKSLSPNTMLWEISGKQLAQPAYVFGTMHMLCAEDARLSAALKNLMPFLKQIYFEVDLDDMVQVFGSLKSMAMQNGTTLKTLLPAADYEKVERYFSSHSALPFSMIQNYKPMLLAAMVEEAQMPCKETNGMEMSILSEANKYHLEINGLETMAFQAGLFDSIPYAEQATELLAAVESVKSKHEQMDTLLLNYRTQDLEKLNVMMTAGGEGLEHKYLDLLLYARNKRWAGQFEAISKKGPLLIAVGAGHLPGENGLLALLRQKGYTVTPLKN